MSYNITHWYTGHNYIIEEFKEKEEAIAVFDELIKNWGEPDPSDEFLELYYYNEETGMVEDIRDHNLTDPDTWEED